MWKLRYIRNKDIKRCVYRCTGFHAGASSNRFSIVPSVLTHATTPSAHAQTLTVAQHGRLYSNYNNRTNRQIASSSVACSPLQSSFLTSRSSYSAVPACIRPAASSTSASYLRSMSSRARQQRSVLDPDQIAIVDSTPLIALPYDDAHSFPIKVIMAPGDSSPRIPPATTPSVAGTATSQAGERYLQALDNQPWPTLGHIPQLSQDLLPTLKIQGIVRVGEDQEVIETEMKNSVAHIDNSKQEQPLIADTDTKSLGAPISGAFPSSSAVVPSSSSSSSAASISSSPAVPPASWSGGFATNFEYISHPQLIDGKDLPKFITASRDPLLLRLARTYDCRVMGSTSSTTKLLSHFILSLTNFHEIQAEGILSVDYADMPKRATSAERAPSIVLLRKRREGDQLMKDVESEQEELRMKKQFALNSSVSSSSPDTDRSVLNDIPPTWSIDSDPSWSNPINRILMELGHTMEAYFTHTPEQFQKKFRETQEGKRDEILRKEMHKAWKRWLRTLDRHLDRPFEPTPSSTKTDADADAVEGQPQSSSEADLIEAALVALEESVKREKELLESSSSSSASTSSNVADNEQTDDAKISTADSDSTIEKDSEHPASSEPDAVADADGKIASSSVSSDVAAEAAAESAAPKTTTQTETETETEPSAAEQQNLSEAVQDSVSEVSSPPSTVSSSAAGTETAKQSPPAKVRKQSRDDADSQQVPSSSTYTPPLPPPRPERDSFLFVKIGDIMFRSQLDCYAPQLTTRKELQGLIPRNNNKNNKVAVDEEQQAESTDDKKDSLVTSSSSSPSSSSPTTLPTWPSWELGGIVFDLKTRAVLPIRLFCRRYSELLDYNILYSRGTLYSYEREYYDMQRSAFLKYSLQCRIGRMGGVMIAYHNTTRCFGFHYLSIKEMDESLFGHTCIGEWVFREANKLLNQHLIGNMNEHTVAMLTADGKKKIQHTSLLPWLEQINADNWRRQFHVQKERLRIEENEKRMKEYEKAHGHQGWDIVNDSKLGKVMKDAKKDGAWELFREINETDIASNSSSPSQSQSLSDSCASYPSAPPPKPVELVEPTPENPDEYDLSTPPSLNNLKITFTSNQSDSSYVIIYVELLPFDEINDPEYHKPWLERYTSQRYVDSLPNYKIRAYLRELKLNDQGDRVAIVSRLEGALALKPFQAIPNQDVFVHLARQNLLHKFIVKIQMNQQQGENDLQDEEDEEGDERDEEENYIQRVRNMNGGIRTLERTDINNMIKKWAKKLRRLDDEAEGVDGSSSSSASSVGDGDTDVHDRAIAPLRSKVSAASLSNDFARRLSISTSLTHISVEDNMISAQQLASDYRNVLISSRLGEDSGAVDLDVVKALKLTMLSLKASRARSVKLQQLEQKRERERKRKLQEKEDEEEEKDGENESEKKEETGENAEANKDAATNENENQQQEAEAAADAKELEEDKRIIKEAETKVDDDESDTNVTTPAASSSAAKKSAASAPPAVHVSPIPRLNQLAGRLPARESLLAYSLLKRHSSAQPASDSIDWIHQNIFKSESNSSLNLVELNTYLGSELQNIFNMMQTQLEMKKQQESKIDTNTLSEGNDVVHEQPSSQANVAKIRQEFDRLTKLITKNRNIITPPGTRTGDISDKTKQQWLSKLGEYQGMITSMAKLADIAFPVKKPVPVQAVQKATVISPSTKQAKTTSRMQRAASPTSSSSSPSDSAEPAAAAAPRAASPAVVPAPSLPSAASAAASSSSSASSRTSSLKKSSKSEQADRMSDIIMQMSHARSISTPLHRKLAATAVETTQSTLSSNESEIDTPLNKSTTNKEIRIRPSQTVVRTIAKTPSVRVPSAASSAAAVSSSSPSSPPTSYKQAFVIPRPYVALRTRSVISQSVPTVIRVATRPSVVTPTKLNVKSGQRTTKENNKEKTKSTQ